MVDMRNSTRLAETRLPFDAVFIVDRFVTAAGAAVDANGGRVSHFLGDGLMATFGLRLWTEKPPAFRRCPRLVDIGRNIAALNRVLVAETGDGVSCGIGVHCGQAIVGENRIRNNAYLHYSGRCRETSPRGLKVYAKNSIPRLSFRTKCGAIAGLPEDAPAETGGHVTRTERTTFGASDRTGGTTRGSYAGG